MKKYIFIVGAPGSKWSSIAKNIYYSPDIDRTDFNDNRTYAHSANGESNVMHIGAYFDPGMEFGHWFDRIEEFDVLSCETEFNRPFNGTGTRIIKSHVLSNHINYLKRTWPDCRVVLVHRNNEACLDWWTKCGGFDITYPKYDMYYKNLNTMAEKIAEQNKNILAAWDNYMGVEINDNLALCNVLEIEHPPSNYRQQYNINDIRVKMI